MISNSFGTLVLTLGFPHGIIRIYHYSVDCKQQGENVSTTLTRTASKASTPTKRSRRTTVQHTELEALIGRRQRSSFPTDARTERAYWLKQIRNLIDS